MFITKTELDRLIKEAKEEGIREAEQKMFEKREMEETRQFIFRRIDDLERENRTRLINIEHRLNMDSPVCGDSEPLNCMKCQN